MAIGIIPIQTSASISNADAIGIVEWNNIFRVNVKWTYTSYDSITIKLFHNSIEIAKDTGYSGSSGNEYGEISDTPIKKGTYRVGLWSNIDNKEVYSKEWEIPKLQISLSVSPTNGQIGTTFIATTTFSTGTNGPDCYYFSGNLEISTGSISFKQNIEGTIFSSHYYPYFGITNYEIEPVFTSTGFTFPSKGDYTISAKYTDSLTDITATSSSVNVIDQYEPQINKANQELNETKDQLNKAKLELSDTKTQLDKINQELNETKKQLNNTNQELSKTNEDLTNEIQISKQYAYIGICIGIIGMVIGIIGIIFGKKKQQPILQQYPTQPPQYQPPPPQHPMPPSQPPQYPQPPPPY